MVILYKDPEEEQTWKSSLPATSTGIGQQHTDFEDVGTLKAEIAQLKAKIKELNVSIYEDR